jgi:nitrogen regulatory protein P-II 1
VKLVTAVVRGDRLSLVAAALNAAGVRGLTVSHTSGPGGAGEQAERDPLTRLEVVVSEPFIELTIAAIASAAAREPTGDVMICIQPVERVIRVRKGEEDMSAPTAPAPEPHRVNAVRP